MSSPTLLLVVLVISISYWFIANRAVAQSRSADNQYHSLPHYYGLYAALLASIPALLLLAVLAIGDDLVFQNLALDFVPEDVQASKNYKQVIVLAQIENVVDGINFGEQPQWVNAAAAAWRGWISSTPSTATESVVPIKKGRVG